MNLAIAISIAADAHVNQIRWDGSPYITHPIRVMIDMDTEEEKIVAILHDVIEDTNVTAEMLLDVGFDRIIINAVIALTKVEGELYEDYIQRVKDNHIARKVKLADIKDNLDVTLIRNVSEKHRQRINKYLDAIQFLS